MAGGPEAVSARGALPPLPCHAVDVCPLTCRSSTGRPQRVGSAPQTRLNCGGNHRHPLFYWGGGEGLRGPAVQGDAGVQAAAAQSKGSGAEHSVSTNGSFAPTCGIRIHLHRSATHRHGDCLQTGAKMQFEGFHLLPASGARVTPRGLVCGESIRKWGGGEGSGGGVPQRGRGRRGGGD